MSIDEHYESDELSPSRIKAKVEIAYEGLDKDWLKQLKQQLVKRYPFDEKTQTANLGNDSLFKMRIKDVLYNVLRDDPNIIHNPQRLQEQTAEKMDQAMQNPSQVSGHLGIPRT